MLLVKQFRKKTIKKTHKITKKNYCLLHAWYIWKFSCNPENKPLMSTVLSSPFYRRANTAAYSVVTCSRSWGEIVEQTQSQTPGLNGSTRLTLPFPQFISWTKQVCGNGICSKLKRFRNETKKCTILGMKIHPYIKTGSGFSSYSEGCRFSIIVFLWSIS